jgi:hypothetical protein
MMCHACNDHPISQLPMKSLNVYCCSLTNTFSFLQHMFLERGNKLVCFLCSVLNMVFGILAH